MSVVAFAAPASAAEITGVITDVDVSPTDPKIGASVRTDIDWCIPNGTHAGDTFTLTLSKYLRNVPAGFDLRDGPGGPLVATAVISPTSPAVITFTMTAYAESHISVCGSAFVETGFDNSLPANVTVPFESTDGGGKHWETPITPQPGTDTPSVDKGIKFGGFPTEDNGHTDPNDAINWTILTPQGPLNSVVITDTVADGQNIDCASVTILMGPRELVNIGSPIVPAPIITPLACTPESLSVTVGPLADGQAVRVRFLIDLDGPSGPGRHGYTNTATMVSTHPNGDVSTDTPRANIGSNNGDGTGGGEDTTPEIDIIKFATADGPVDGTFDEAPGKLVPAGTPVPVTMTITNTGDEALKDVTVSDTTNTGPAMTGLTCDFSPLGGPATGTTWAGPLAVDASFDCTGTVPALPAGVPHADTADVVGTGNISLIGVDDDDPFNVTPPPPTPVIDIIKFATADGPVAGTFDEAPGKLVAAGTPVPVTMTIKNTGDEPLKDVTVADTTTAGPAMTGLTCDFSPLGGPATGTTWAGPLAVDASFDCTGTVPAMAVGDAHANTADVVGTGTISLIGVDDDDPFNVTPPPPTPVIDIIKFATEDGPVDGTFDTAPGKLVPAGTPVPVTMTITNDGDEPLKDVTVSDTTNTGSAMTGLTCDFSKLGGPATGTTWAGPLAVDASFDCTGTVPAMAAGETHANTADVVGTGTISLIGVDDDDPFNVTPPPPTPGIGIVKGDSDGNAADTADTKVTLPSDGTASLVFAITNTGDEALRNVVVSDTVVSNGTVTGLSCVFPDGSTGTTWAGPLAIGASFDCTASLSGVKPGSNHEDVATVTGVGVISGTPVDSKNPYFGHVRPVPVTPAATTPPTDLAHTGSGAAPVAVVSALLLLLGGILVGRRRLSAMKADRV